MPSLTIPLIGSPTQRGLNTATALAAGQDQRFINCLFYSAEDAIQGNKNVYVQKRQGLETFSTPASGNTGNFVFVRPSSNIVISVFGSAGVFSIYSGTTNCGVIDAGVSVQMNEAILNGVAYVMFTTTLGTGWFLPSDAVSGFTFTGDTHTNTTIDNISSIVGLYVGQLISGTGIQAGTRIATITSPSTITTTIATTATNAGVTITRAGVAKIISANFPVANGLVEMDGFIFAADTTNARIYNSDINSITNWSANSFIPVNISSDSLQFAGKYRNRILGCGVNVIEQFINTGNAAGSILSSQKNETISVGATTGIAQINEYLFFCGPPTLNPGIWMMSPNGVNKISTPVIDRNLSSFGFFSDSISCIFYAGYTWLIFFASSGTIFTYCVEMNTWNEQAFSASIVGANGLRRVSNVGGSFFVGATTGKIYVWDASPVYQDDGVAYTMTIQTEPKVPNKGRGFIINSVELLADNQSSGSTTLEISRDDYASFQTLGSFDLTQRRKRIVRGGLCRNHAIFRVTDSGNNAWRGQALIVDYTPCAT